MTPPDVHLIFSGLLVNWVVEVDRVGVLQPVVPPEQNAAGSHDTDDGCRTETRPEGD